MNTLQRHRFTAQTWLLAVVVVLAVIATVLYWRSPWRGLPYQDSFNAGKTSEWTPYAGNWSLTNGGIRNDSNERGAKLITGSPFWRDYSVEADMELLGEGGDAGLMIRASDIEHGVDSYNGYYAGLRTADQSLVLGRAEHGWIEFPPAKMPGGIRPGRWYHLKLGAFGCNISVSAQEIGRNNAQTITAHDPNCFHSGKIGLRSMVAGGVWRNVHAERLSNAEAAVLTSAKSPAQMMVYPTNQGTMIVPENHLQAAPEAPRGPFVPIHELRLFPVTRPVHVAVRGTVILTDPLYVQDSSGGVEVVLRDRTLLRVGDEVEVEGDVYPEGLIAVIRNATARPSGGMAPRPPLSVTADQAATGAYHAMFLEVEGTLQNKTSISDGMDVLELRDGLQVFRALPASLTVSDAFRKLEKKSLVRLRGVCLVDAAHTQNAVPFALLVSSPEDVKVLVGPPWWSADHLIALALIMLAAGYFVHCLYSRAEQWRLRAVIDERERLAHEIHDTLAQSFAGIGFQLRAIRNRISKNSGPPDKPALLEELDRAAELVRHSHDEARRSITTLRPDATEAGGLIAALEQIALQMVGRHAVQIETSVEGEARPIPLRVLDCLFRIGQESIANAIQHGHPSRLIIRAVYHPAEITLVIEDNGNGFVPRHESDGFGLTAMRQRAESIGGSLTIDTAPGRGTRIEAHAPAPPEKHRLLRLAYDEEKHVQ